MNVSLSRNRNDSRKVRSFLYQIYFNELQWSPPADNPSGWKVEEGTTDQPRFIDNFENQAKWIWVSDDDENILSCCRLITPIEKKLEYELYTPAMIEIESDSSKIELNRFAINHKLLNTNLPLKMLYSALEFCTLEKKHFLVIPTPEVIYEYCVKLGFHCSSHAPFKYSDTDPDSIKLVYLDLQDKVHIEKVRREWRDLLR